MEFFENSEIRISDHHSLTVTVLRSQLVKSNGGTKLYRDYNSFDVRLFKPLLRNVIKWSDTL